MPAKREKSQSKSVESEQRIVKRYLEFKRLIKTCRGESLRMYVEALATLGGGLEAPKPQIEGALHAMLRTGHDDAAEELIAHGASLFSRSPKGKLPVELAGDPFMRERLREMMESQASKAKGAAKKAMEADAQIAKKVCEEGISELFLHVVVRHPEDGREARLRELVAAGADVNFKARDGMTALHYVARHRDVEQINFLLSMGADPFAKTNEGELPIDRVQFFPRMDRKHGEEKQEALRAGMTAWERKQLDAAAKPAKPPKPKGEKKPGRDKGL